MSNFIDLNSDEFTTKRTAIFNDGIAGIVENVGVSITNEDKRWIITYTDPNGGTLKDFFSYVSGDSPEAVKAQGFALKSMWNEFVGEHVQIPVFRTSEEMLDSIMTRLSAIAPKIRIRIAVDYGEGKRHSLYLRRKKFTPFLENMNKVPSELTMSRTAYKEPAEISDENTLFQKGTKPLNARDWS